MKAVASGLPQNVNSEKISKKKIANQIDPSLLQFVSQTAFATVIAPEGHVSATEDPRVGPSLFFSSPQQQLSKSLE